MPAFSSLSKELSAYLPAEQVDEIREAYLFAAKAHQEQTRTTGAPFIIHPVAVATVLARMRMDAQTIKAALLHDVIEDTDIDKATIARKFGKSVAELVDGVSKLTQIEFESRAEAQAENFRKMMIAMARDIRVILVKLADRLHNMRTLRRLMPAKRRRIANETLEIYAPIANRLGMHRFRIAFEELAFEMGYPMRYRVLKESVKKARGNRREIITVIQSSVNKALENAEFVDFQLTGREKHLYSIYRKMKNKRLKFSEVMDVYAFRIVVQSVDECYRALGIVHNLYKPLPERFKDYIAIPKANGYQSLHTTLFGPYGLPIEIQIRTKDMDKMDENGIAAHWLYKSEEHIVQQSQLRAREWIKGLLEMQQNAGTSLEFIENVKIDLFPDEIYVFTPTGKILELPSGATAVDFAYAVHSDIGNQCVAAKIDRHLSPLSTQLYNGQTVEIITAPGARPNPAWLNFIVTGKARSRIHHFLKHQKRTESVELGKRLVENALANLDTHFNAISKENVQRVLSKLKYPTLSKLYEEVGQGIQLAQIVARRLLQLEDFEVIETSTGKLHMPLTITGSEGIVVSFANCCRPIPGDPIQGVLTAGHGIVIHREECGNLADSCRQPDKCIQLRWEEDIHGDFEVELRVEIINQRGVFANLSLAVADCEANIENITVGEQVGQYNIVNLIVSVRDCEHLTQVIRRIQQLNSVTKVERC